MAPMMQFTSCSMVNFVVLSCGSVSMCQEPRIILGMSAGAAAPDPDLDTETPALILACLLMILLL